MLEEASGVDVVDCFKTFNKFKSKSVMNLNMQWEINKKINLLITINILWKISTRLQKKKTARESIQGNRKYAKKSKPDYFYNLAIGTGSADLLGITNSASVRPCDIDLWTGTGSLERRLTGDWGGVNAKHESANWGDELNSSLL